MITKLNEFINEKISINDDETNQVSISDNKGFKIVVDNTSVKKIKLTVQISDNNFIQSPVNNIDFITNIKEPFSKNKSFDFVHVITQPSKNSIKLKYENETLIAFGGRVAGKKQIKISQKDMQLFINKIYNMLNL